MCLAARWISSRLDGPRLSGAIVLDLQDSGGLTLSQTIVPTDSPAENSMVRGKFGASLTPAADRAKSKPRQITQACQRLRTQPAL